MVLRFTIQLDSLGSGTKCAFFLLWLTYTAAEQFQTELTLLKQHILHMMFWTSTIPHITLTTHSELIQPREEYSHLKIKSRVSKI